MSRQIGPVLYNLTVQVTLLCLKGLCVYLLQDFTHTHSRISLGEKSDLLHGICFEFFFFLFLTFSLHCTDKGTESSQTWQCPNAYGHMTSHYCHTTFAPFVLHIILWKPQTVRKRWRKGIKHNRWELFALPATLESFKVALTSGVKKTQNGISVRSRRGGLDLHSF